MPWITDDPLNQVLQKIPIRNLVTIDQMLRQLSQGYRELKVPYLMLLAGQDTIVENKEALKVFEGSDKVGRKEVVVYEECDHMSLVDKEYVGDMVQKICGFFENGS